MDRSQFTFYESFFTALTRIRKDADRAKAYDAICRYALYSTEPDLDAMPDAAAIAFDLIKPVLDASKRKAAAGKAGGRPRKSESKAKADGKQSENNPKAGETKPEANESEGESEKEKEGEKEEEIEDECPPPISPGVGEKADAAFDSFWAAYPRKQGKGAARKAFQKARKKASLETMLSAIQQQRQSAQWRRDGGQYIPQPATWLNQERWGDELDTGYQSSPQRREPVREKSFLELVEEREAREAQGMLGGNYHDG